MTQPVSSHRERRILAVTVGLGPIWFLVYVLIAAPGFLEPLGDPAVAVGGIPLGWILTVAAAGLSVAAAVAIERSNGNRWLGLVVLLLVFPALFLVVIGPAIVLIAKNLGSG